jgi:hypothetical protein
MLTTGVVISTLLPRPTEKSSQVESSTMTKMASTAISVVFRVVFTVVPPIAFLLGRLKYPFDREQFNP